MPFGRGFGFRGRSPAWPYTGRGRGGLPRCWAYRAYWDPTCADPGWFDPYPSPVPGYWEPYGMNYRYYSNFYPEYPQTVGLWENAYVSPMMTAEGEKEWLMGQAESIKQEIDEIKSRLSEIEKE